MSRSFAERVIDAVSLTGPLCAGIDPSSQLLSKWGLDDSVSGLEEFVTICLDAFIGKVSAIKPQVAFFERFGSAGFAVLERLAATARSSQVLTIMDAKRSDIGSTSQAYAKAWLSDASPLAADAVTLNPYLGLGTLFPFVECARESSRGIFVVVASSNPEGRPIQLAVTETGISVEDSLLRGVALLNDDERAIGHSIGSTGVVIGATIPSLTFPLDQVNGIFLVPGFGTQGGTAKNISNLFDRCTPGSVLVNVSRSLLDFGPKATELTKAVSLIQNELISMPT